MTLRRRRTSRMHFDRIAVPRRRGVDDPVRFGAGVEFGSDGICLVQSLDAEGHPLAMLIWFVGCTTASCGVRGFGREYQPARLKIVKRRGFESVDLKSGGRLSNAVVQQFEPAIDATFGSGTALQIDIRRTLVITDG